jgi:hypothetical protein
MSRCDRYLPLFVYRSLSGAKVGWSLPHGNLEAALGAHNLYLIFCLRNLIINPQLDANYLVFQSYTSGL